MKNKFVSAFMNRTVWVMNAIALAGAAAYGIFVHPFYLHFIDGLTFAAFLYLLIGLIQWAYKRADFVFFSWKPEKGSYNRYRRKLLEERKDMKNPVLTAGLILLVISMILAFTY